MASKPESKLTALHTDKAEILYLLTHPQSLFNGECGINARDVHRFLKVGRDYSKWIKARIKQAGFLKNQDFVTVENGDFLRDKIGEQKENRGGHNRLDYIVTLETAKHLCLMEKNEIGRVIRQHFIEAENQLRTHAPKVHRNTAAKTLERLENIDRNREMTDAIKARLQRLGIKAEREYYIQEQEMIDYLVIGENVRQWKARHGIKGSARDHFNAAQLRLLKILQATNAALINLDMNYHERKGRLIELAQREGEKQ